MRPIAPDGPRAELLGGLGAGDQTPLPRGHGLRKGRITLGRLLAVHAALPVAEKHLSKVALDRGFQSEPLCEGRGRLVSTPELVT